MDYAVLEKVYAGPAEGQKRYSPPVCVGAKRHEIMGRPDQDHVSTTMRSWTESTFLLALSPNRPLEERQSIIDRYYIAYETLVREDPVGHGMDYVHIYLTIAKTDA